MYPMYSLEGVLQLILSWHQDIYSSALRIHYTYLPFNFAMWFLQIALDVNATIVHNGIFCHAYKT